MNKDNGQLLEERDVFQGLTVTRVSDSYCFFGKKRISWSRIKTLMKSGERIKHQRSPDMVVDWTSKEAVMDYFNCFEEWSLYHSGCFRDFVVASTQESVKGGLIFHKGEFYLPTPTAKMEGNNHRSNLKMDPLPKDGRYNVDLFKVENKWYPRKDPEKRTSITLNLYYIKSEVKPISNNMTPLRDTLYGSSIYNGPISFSHDFSIRTGISFNLGEIDSVGLFKYVFLGYAHSINEVRYEVDEASIRQVMDPISGEIRKILIQELYDVDNLGIDIDNSYGEISIGNTLTFSKKVSSRIIALMQESVTKNLLK